MPHPGVRCQVRFLDPRATERFLAGTAPAHAAGVSYPERLPLPLEDGGLRSGHSEEHLALLRTVQFQNHKHASMCSPGRTEIDQLADFKPPSISNREKNHGPMVVHYTDTKGRPRVKGGAGLKKSQHYPRQRLGFFHQIYSYITICTSRSFAFFIIRDDALCWLRFGKALARLRTRLQPKIKREARAFKKAAEKQPGKVKKLLKDFSKWVTHAELEPIFEYLSS